MPRVRPHTRKDGTRVKGHYRRRRQSVPRRRRALTRAGSGRSRSQNYRSPVLCGLAALIALGLAVGFIRQHPFWSAFLVLLVVAGTVAVAVAMSQERARQRAEQAERDRLIAVTDAMSGPEFEQWVARLLTRSGFSGAAVCGGSGDRGADVIAQAPDGRRVVVQCKRHSPSNRVGSPAIQRFAGTCRAIHRGEICMIVTNGYFAAGDGLRLARELDIALVDRQLLETWAYTGTPPRALWTGALKNSDGWNF